MYDPALFVIVPCPDCGRRYAHKVRCRFSLFVGGKLQVFIKKKEGGDGEG